jgi:hypothetical protein
VPASRLKATPGGAGVAQVAKDHGLHIDGRAPALRNVVELAVDLGAVVVPAFEHRHHGAPELFPGVGRELAADARADQRLEAGHQLLQIGRVELGVELDALLGLEHVDDHLKGIVVFLAHGLQAHHHVAVHLHEAAVGVPGETFVAGLARQADHGLVVEPQVEDGVHHAGHRSPRAGTHRQQQRVVGIAKALAHLLLDEGQAITHLGVDQAQRMGLALFREDRAGLGADGEAAGHGDAQAAHFGQVGALATQQVLHRSGTLGAGRAETIDVLPFICSTEW